MNYGLKKTAVSLVGILAATALVATGCGGTREEEDAGTTPKVDGGTSIKTDAGQQQNNPDGGHEVPSVTIPVISNQLAAGHPAAGGQVSFQGVVVSPRYRITKSTSNSDSRYWYCLYGVFMADPDATSADYNGVLVVSKSTVDATTKNCNSDSQFTQNGGDVAIGDWLQVKGLYKEYCGNYDSAAHACKDKDSAGTDMTIAEIEANMAGDVEKLGTKPLPATLPVTVTIDQISSAGTASPFTLGTDWWKYRSVLVKLDNVVADVSGNLPSCNWTIHPAAAATPTLIVNDDVMFSATTCPDKPAQDQAFTSVTGNVQWLFGATQLSPRSNADLVTAP